DIQQAPPVYSALKVAGERAYKLARSGQLSALPTRTVTAFELELVGFSENTADFQLRCGKGFYVRSLARDLGEALGTKAHVTALRRTHVGPFGLKQAISLAILDSMVDNPHQLLPVLPIDVVLDDIPVLTLSSEQARYLRQGRFVHLSDLYALNPDVDVSMDGLAKFEGQPLGLVEFQDDMLKVKRLFNLNPQADDD
ncbi:MAG: tRNA pseudouridine(55) synthase TruB, partial [Alphaproteobacteria bacterium]